jgi:acyl-CoA thioesterase
MEISGTALQELNNNPLYRTVGLRVEKAFDGKAKSCLTPNPNVCWPFPGQVHGGILATVMDTTMAWAVFSKLEQDLNCTTINLDIQYIHPAKQPPLYCSAETSEYTRRLCFARSEIRNADGQILAAAQGTFRIIHATLDFVSR